LRAARITTLHQCQPLSAAHLHPGGYNRELAVAATETGSAFVPWIGGELNEILCLQEERVVRP
jgi:hypothetical protein